jgi:hypothetical protein
MTQDQFIELSDAVRDFWTMMPERLMALDA